MDISNILDKNWNSTETIRYLEEQLKEVYFTAI